MPRALAPNVSCQAKQAAQAKRAKQAKHAKQATQAKSAKQATQAKSAKQAKQRLSVPLDIPIQALRKASKASKAK